MPLTIKLSHVGFENIELKIRDNIEYLKIELEPTTINLPEFIIENLGKSYLKLAVNKLLENNPENHFFEGYFRKTSQANKNIYGFYEIYFAAKSNYLGIQEWKPKKGRYAELNDFSISTLGFSPQISFSKSFLETVAQLKLLFLTPNFQNVVINFLFSLRF